MRNLNSQLSALLFQWSGFNLVTKYDKRITEIIFNCLPGWPVSAVFRHGLHRIYGTYQMLHIRFISEINFSFISRWHQMTRGSSSSPHRRMQPTRISTTCSSCLSLATAVWEKPPSCSATPTTPSPLPSSAPWASTSRLRLSSAMTRGSSCRSGWVN